MSNIQNQKSGLAKLMATENLIVQHAKVATAMFDPKNRVLTCPIWEQMSGDLYDLLMGHEVGHAIDTPADGWHGAVHDRGVNYKGFLNVVEDARIEKRQKRRYPGLRRSFTNGFNELMAKDFFGLRGRNVNTLPFIDRLNIYTKSSYSLPVVFNATEQEFVDRVQACETWDDVLKVTNEIWDYSKEEQSETNTPQDSFGQDDADDDYETETGQNDGDAETDGEGNEPAKSKQKGEDGDEEKESSSSADEESDEDGDIDGETKNKIDRYKESQSVNEDQTSEPRCETDENFRQNESKLIAKHAREYVYIDIPKPNLKKIVTPAKLVQEILTKEFSDQTASYEQIANTLYNDFRRKNERFISLLAKEFEMRKAADKFSKAKVSSTGDIDVSRVFKYQIDDNIFKKVMRVPKGKSHGLILLLDKSGSMSDNLAASYEQILILAMFCRKVNIPFSAYGFGNADHIREKDFPGEVNYKDATHTYGCFTENEREMWVSSVYLREMINSKMSNSEFSKAVKNILCLMDAWSCRYGTRSNFYRPPSDSLSNTPMTEALIACQPLINEFKTVNNLDIVNLCVVHDGDADDINSYHVINDVRISSRNFFNSSYQNVFLCDKKNKVQQEVVGKEDGVRIAISKWLTKTTGVKIIGFYLAPNSAMKGAVRRRLFNPELNELRKEERTNWLQLKEAYAKYIKILRKEKFLESKNAGYESFFLLPGGNELDIDDEDFEAPSKVTTATLTKAFSKFTKNRQVNRVLVSRFISMIAV